MENNTTKEKFVRIIRKLVFGFSIGWGVLFGLILMVSKMGFLTNVFAYIIFGILPIMLAIIITEKISENVLKEKITAKRKKIYFGLLGGMTLIILISGIGENKNKTETVKQNVVKTEDNTKEFDKNIKINNSFNGEIIYTAEYFPIKNQKSFINIQLESEPNYVWRRYKGIKNIDGQEYYSEYKYIIPFYKKEIFYKDYSKKSEEINLYKYDTTGNIIDAGEIKENKVL